MQPLGSIEATYRDFAEYAAGTSPCFAEWAAGVAGDPEVRDWLARLPEPKRQPNLVFAAARWHGVPAPAPYADLRDALLADRGPIRTTVLNRSTQTNEVGRLATLVPAFAAVTDGRPAALLEVGASAGLCLYPDRWTYRWDTADGPVVLENGGDVLATEASGPVPLPVQLPEVVWRSGIDINPLDVRSDDAARWLSALVWPEHHDRRERLALAIDIARREPPSIRRADLLDALPFEVGRALDAIPDEAVLLVFHSAVIAYLDDDGRRRFDAMMRELVADPRVHWVSNEGRNVLPSISTTGPGAPSGRFVLGIDGRAVGYTEGHGRSVHWWDDGKIVD